MFQIYCTALQVSMTIRLLSSLLSAGYYPGKYLDMAEKLLNERKTNAGTTGYNKPHNAA